MARRLVMVLLLAASAPLCAQITPEIAVGVAQAAPQHNGTWYQQGFAHQLDLTSDVVTLGLRGDMSHRAALHVDAVWLGRYASDSQDVTQDALYDPATPTHCVSTCPPLAHYMGRGSVAGVQALLELHSTGAWRYGAEIGPLVYRESWLLDVPNWYATDPSQIAPVHVNQSRWSIGWVAGVEITHGRWSMSLLQYHHTGANFSGHVGIWPPIWRSQTVISLGFRI